VKSTLQKDIAKKLGKRIAGLRKIKKFSQADLSYEAEIDLSTLSRLERGILNVTLETLVSIAKVLKVDIKDLFE
jgi:transcriptional regulator with XRE-family HTH domain